MSEMRNDVMETTAEAVAEPVYENTYAAPVQPMPSYQEQPQTVEEPDNSKLGGLLIAGAVAVGYAAGAVVEKVKAKVAAKKASQPQKAKPAKKRVAWRSPVYYVEEPAPAPAPAADPNTQNQNNSENSEK